MNAGQCVIVTGASGNLGRAVVKHLAAHGARLVLVDRDMGRLEAVAAEFALTDHHLAVTDAGDVAACAALVAAVVQRYGRVDGLIHTVGGFDAGTPIHQTSVDVYEKMMALNARPLFVLGGAVGGQMAAQGGGKIAFVLAKGGAHGAAGMGAYTASKAAAQRIMESMSAELKDHGVNVNGVAPSIIDTPPNRASMPNADFSKWVTTEQLAAVLAFLLSPDAAALHGVTLDVLGRV
jgi:NAD(P)-dependent dehydrogenase (short-subunit alcohol dehydrogenase family)